MEQSKRRKISKIYRALVNGILKQDKVTPWLNHCFLLPFLFVAYIHSGLCCAFSSGWHWVFCVYNAENSFCIYNAENLNHFIMLKTHFVFIMLKTWTICVKWFFVFSQFLFSLKTTLHDTDLICIVDYHQRANWNNALPWSGQRAVCCFTLRFIKCFPQ